MSGKPGSSLSELDIANGGRSRPRLSAVTFFAGAAQSFGQRPTAGLYGTLALRQRFRGSVRAVPRRSLRLFPGAGLIVKTQRQGDALASNLDLQHLHLDDVAWF